jgi:hypothetical protein
LTAGEHWSPDRLLLDFTKSEQTMRQTPEIAISWMFADSATVDQGDFAPQSAGTLPEKPYVRPFG